MFSYLKRTDLCDIDRDDLGKLSIKLTDLAKVSHRLLRRGNPEDITLSVKLLEKLINAQDSDQQSPYYGLWPLFENIPNSTTPVYDKNATTYIGIPLFLLYAEHSHLLPTDLLKKIENSLSIACLFIMHRNIHLQNTHITIAESFLTAVCGERFNIPEFTTYAVNLFQNFYHYNIAEGSFTEYNTPFYDKNNLCILYLSKRYIKNELFLRLTDIISDSLWEIAATHYHYQSNSFSGPMHRSASLFTPEDITDFFTKSRSEKRQKDNQLTFEITCPQKYLRYFNGTKRAEYSQKIVSHGSSYPYYFYSRIATTLIKPSYCIGTFCRGECWEELMSFLGYFGTRNSRFAIKITTIHDGHEYSSAQLSMVQYMNYVLGHTTFATNKGDKHIDHDNINGKIRAKDLRVRFLISGDISKLSVIRKKNTLRVNHRDVQIQFMYSFGAFGNYKPKIELSKEKNLYFDMVLYSGKSITINFDEIKKAIVSWVFCISDRKIPNFHVTDSYDKKYVTTKYVCPDSKAELSLMSYYKPDTHENIHVNNKQYIDGILFEKYVLRNSNLMEQYSYIIEYMPTSFELNLTDDKTIFNMIYAIKDLPEEDIIPSVRNTFSKICKNNLTLFLTKRLAIQIMSNVFDYYKENSIQFNNIIQDYSKFYQFQISSAPDTDAIAYHLFEILNLLHSIYESSETSESIVALINQITDLINKEYNNPNLSREYIAEKCGKSIYAVSRAFKKTSGFTYIDYLTHIRINKAKDYLKNSDLSVDEIAQMVGYINLSSFIRTFKKKTGKTPSNYRRR